MSNPNDGSTHWTALDYDNERRNRHNVNPPQRAIHDALAPLSPEERRHAHNRLAYLLALPWLAALAVAIAHGLQRHRIPELPYGFPIMAVVLVITFGILVTTRHKLRWIGMSLVTATLAAAYL
jgi:hypothetical protein